jgi:DNA-directed RNA polymerase specialized sigma24 family protein
MGAISAIRPPAEIKQHNSIAVKQSSLEVCKNRKDMPFKDLLSSVTKKLMSYAMMLTGNNEDDAWDLIQSTIEKLIKNKEILQASNQPVAYAKRILKNNFIDNYRKE